MATFFVIPCSGPKAATARPAHALYAGTMFQHTLASACTMAAAEPDTARVLILSARHGLIGLDDVVEPYEQQMGKPGAVSPATIAAQAYALGIDWTDEVYAMLPRTYYEALDSALRTFDCYPHDVYEATQGIGEQRKVNRLSKEA